MAERDEPEEESSGATILLVEDDEVVRDMIQFVLRSKGYRVHSANNGPEALEIWAKRGDEVDLLITDQVMPGKVTGVDLATRLRRERPTLKVIYVSGYGPEIERLDCRERETVFVAKPFDVKALTGAIRSLLKNGV